MNITTMPKDDLMLEQEKLRERLATHERRERTTMREWEEISECKGKLFQIRCEWERRKRLGQEEVAKLGGL